MGDGGEYTSWEILIETISTTLLRSSHTKKKVSSSPYEHMLGKPDVKYIGNIHGNEPVGRELLLHLIQYLVTNYETDPYIKWLLDNTRIHIMPAMNPGMSMFHRTTHTHALDWFNQISHVLRWLCCFDGRCMRGRQGKVKLNREKFSFSQNTGWCLLFFSFSSPQLPRPISSAESTSYTSTSCRGNAKGFDLNRNFPDYFKQNTKRPQPETEAVKDVSEPEILSLYRESTACISCIQFHHFSGSREYSSCWVDRCMVAPWWAFSMRKFSYFTYTHHTLFSTKLNT